jgi:hypothetical protein
MDIRVMVPGTYTESGTIVQSTDPSKPYPPWPGALRLGPSEGGLYVPVIFPNVPLKSIMNVRYDPTTLLQTYAADVREIPEFTSKLQESQFLEYWYNYPGQLTEYKILNQAY